MGGKLADEAGTCALAGPRGDGCAAEALGFCFLEVLCGSLPADGELLRTVACWACIPTGHRVTAVNSKTKEAARKDLPIRIATLVGRTNPRRREQMMLDRSPFVTLRKRHQGQLTLPAEGSPHDYPAGLLAWGSHSGPPSLRGGIMGRRPPIQLRGSSGFAPASRAPDVKTLLHNRAALVNSW